MSSELQKYRQEINELDLKILNLLNQRMEVVKRIGQLKTRRKLDYYDPKREESIIKKLLRENKGILPNSVLLNIYREIFLAARSLEKHLTIAYWGPEGTFTHLSAVKKFGSGHRFVPMKSIKNVFETIARGHADFGVVPIENSTEGVVNYTLDMFIDFDLKIWAEIKEEIHQHLLSKFEKADIERIYSHPQAIAQTREWIENNLSEVQVVEVATTARAAKLASEEEGAAAIGSELAAKIYGLDIVERNIEDNPYNITRFLVISREMKKKSARNKTSIMFLIKDRVGALYEILKVFAEQQINLTKIESRPSKIKPWEYYFFVDFVGHYEERNVKKALAELKENCLLLKILGSYEMA